MPLLLSYSLLPPFSFPPPVIDFTGTGLALWSLPLHAEPSPELWAMIRGEGGGGEEGEWGEEGEGGGGGGGGEVEGGGGGGEGDGEGNGFD
jgi:hypothetical protein